MNDENSKPTELSRDTAFLLRNIGSAMREALNGSMAASELLGRRLEKQERADEQEFLSILRHDQHRLLRIAENLTELGNLTLGEVRAETDVQDLSLICAELTESISAMSGRVNLEFTHGRGNCFVNGSRDRLETLILNVLAYSLQRCRDGDRIFMRTEYGEKEIRLLFRDTGAGPEGDSLSAMYSALERDPLHGASLGGAGLGLLVAEGIARLYGGSLLLSAAGDSGMEAVLTLPRCRTNLLRLPKVEYGSRLRIILTILSDELGRDKYMPPYL